MSLDPVQVSDMRLDRRAVTLSELRRVIPVAEERAFTLGGLSGPYQTVLYLVACVGGFLADELASLKPGAFVLNTDELSLVTLAPEFAKNGL